MTFALGSVVVLLVGCALLFLAQGLFLVLSPLWLDAFGASPRMISLVATAYFAGFGVGAWRGVELIRRVGHVRAYGGLLALVLVVVLAQPLLPPPAWVLLRFLHGTAASGAMLSVEAWLTSAAPERLRGRVLAAYTLVTLAALGAGPLLLNIHGQTALASFNLGAMLLASSIVPVLLSRVVAPPLARLAVKPRLDLFSKAPLALVAGLAAGLLTGSFWALAPLFGRAAGLATAEVTLLIAVALLGGLTLVWPVGSLSDRMDRRVVIMGLTALGVAASAVLVAFPSLPQPLFYLTFGAYGGVIFSLYPLALSHAADNVADGDDMLFMARSLLLANGIGLALGPLLGGQLFALLGRAGLFVLALVIAGATACFAATRVARFLAPQDKRGFVPVHETTPAELGMDPRLPASIPPDSAPTPSDAKPVGR